MATIRPSGFHGIADRGEFDIVDAQFHLSPEPGLVAVITAMDALGIRSVMFDELWGRNAKDQGLPCIEFSDGAYRPLSPLAQAASLRYPDRFSYMQRITRRDPGLAGLLDSLRTAPGCRSLRISLPDRAERDVFTSGGYDELLSMAQDSGLPLSVLSKDCGILLQGAAPRFPKLQFIIDHCGWGQNEKQWSDVVALALLDNTWLKWSHAGRAFGDGTTYTGAAQTAFRQALGTFGARRMLWAGDITHEESSATWSQLLAFVQYNPAATDTDREWLLSLTARTLFAWHSQ